MAKSHLQVHGPIEGARRSADDLLIIVDKNACIVGREHLRSPRAKDTRKQTGERSARKSACCVRRGGGWNVGERGNFPIVQPAGFANCPWCRATAALQETARKRSRYGHRDATMILIAYRHGLRASEVCGLRSNQIDLNSGRLHVRRAKGGIDNVHPLSGKEIRALRQLRRENMESRYVFITERGGPATTAGFLKMIARTGEAAKLPFPVHPHMLRHSTGYKLANDGHDTRALQHYMGHKNIMHTVRYTEMAPDRFKDFWKD